MTISLRINLAAVCVSVAAASVLAQSGLRTDEYTRHDMLTPETSSVRVTYEVSATAQGARTYVDPIPAGATASDIAVQDMMTGEALKFVVTARDLGHAGAAGAAKGSGPYPHRKDGQ
jgi:hypothetical protein